ncbi:MAG: hypothetical protein GC151_13925 [Betaproteobacteria bacterium]|nr:hypothetical protein [Betaproteobacteria bacterium]
MSTLAEIRAAIVSTLEGVSQIGQVNDYERFAEMASDLVAKYASGGRIKGWFVTRVRTAENDLDLGEVRRVHTWSITGYLSLDDADATSKTLDDLVESICSAFRADRTLGGVVIDTKDMSDEFGPTGIQVDSMDPVMFAKVLCHRARLRLVTETTETV